MTAALTPAKGSAALVGMALLVGCLVTGSGPAASAERPAAVYAYLADNTIVRTDEQFGVWRITRIAPKAAVQGGAGHSLAFSADGRTLWALSVTGQRLVALAPLTLAIRRSIAFPPTEVPRALAVGPRTGRLYVAYTVERPVPKRRDQPKDARLRILDPSGTRRLADTLVRPAGRRSWWVYALAVDQEERRAYVSYHGSDTSGLDTLNIRDRRMTRCRRPGYLVCWGQPHGTVAVVGDNVYAATGAPWIGEYARDGTLGRRLETGLGNVHLMEFAVTPGGDRLYAATWCAFGLAFASVDVASGEATPLKSTACGNSIAATSTSAIVGSIRRGVADPNRRGKLLVVDPATGDVVRQHMTPSEPVDLLAR